jgi:hypothetical protein
MPAGAGDAVAHPELALQPTGGLDRDRDVALRRARPRRLRTRPLERRDLGVELARASGQRAQLVIDRGETAADGLPGRLPLRDVERLRLGPELFRARLGVALDRGLLALRGGDAPLHALALVAQRLEPALELGVDPRARLAGRRAHVDAAYGEARGALAFDADRGWIDRRRQAAQDER